jgi:divalent metal cation (Fe/Co/Zn/Cd) transporter
MPEAQKKALHRARWLEANWLAVLASIVAAIYFAVGSSQAMKTAWIEDLLSFVPPIAFLVGSWIEGWKPNRRFPLGYIRVTSIAYLISAVALGGVGIFLIVDSSIALIKQEHPTIGSVELFGATIWFGWVMIAALGVWGTATGWPDLIVAGIMAGLFTTSAVQILRQATVERRAIV